MTGSGTEQDPYIVDNWEDFTAVTNASTTEIYIKWADSDNKIIDFNDIKPEGFSETVYFPANCDFNGWTLKNFSSNASKAIRSFSTNTKSNISNLNIENFYFKSEESFGYLNFKNCSFAGQSYSTSSNYFSNQCSFTNCSINIKMYTVGQGCIFSYTTCKNSDVIMNVSGSRVSITSNCYLYNSRFSGVISVDSDAINISIGYPCIFNIESNRVLKLISGVGVSVFNSDLAEIYSSSKNLVGVTSDQLKNPEYLASIGFPIGVD